MNVTEHEIASQPDTWRRALDTVNLVEDARSALAAPGESVLALGCGTSWFVAQSYAALRDLAGLGETDARCASEPGGPRRYDRVIAFTRSGTTTEVLDALAAVPEGVRRVTITAVESSPAETISHETVVLPFADESSVVQTRFPTTVLALTRAVFAESAPDLDATGLHTTSLGATGLGASAKGLPDAAQAALEADLPADPADIDHVVFLGHGWTLGLAHEAALKVREAAQAWSESYPVMDFRHGPMAVAGPRSLVWVFGELPAGMAETVAATGATLHHDALDPLAGLILAQRFATALAAHRGLDPDQPRLLTRSVILPRDAAPVG